jgi:ATP-binding cassette, subfamily G (WHITE), member 2, SNQ2
MPSSRVVVSYSCKLMVRSLTRNKNLFFCSAILFPALASLAEISALYGQRPIVSRHKKAAMYHPFIEAYVL